MNLAQEKALLFGSPPSLFRNSSLFYANVLFKMPWLSITTGNHCKLPLLVLVVWISPLNMLCHALKVVSLPFNVMKSGTWQLIYLQKPTMMSALSLNFYPYGEVFTGTSSYSQDGARLDIAANGFWGGWFEHTFFDVRVFNSHAPSNRHPHCYRKHELEKKHHYEQWVREVEHASFTPLVLSATGGMANEVVLF